ncbi:MAG: ABC transporter permease subunit, partial [Acidobacteriota bacterium]
MMLWQILRFEVRLLLKQPLFWLVTFLFTLMGFGLGASDANEIGGAVGNVLRNAPSVIVTLLSLIGTIGIFLTTIFVAGAILRDFEAKTHELFFSRPIAKRDYLLGRFLGSYLMACVAFSGSAFGLFLGSVMPWIDPERLGSFGPAPYLYALFVIVLPNLLFSACVFFCLASLSRSMLRTYMGVVGFFALSALSDTLLDDLDNEFLAAWLDPFGIGALDYATKYWTVVERNSLLPELGGIVLYNRLLWVGIGLAFLAYALYAFRPTATLLRKRRTRGLSGSEQDAGAPATGSTTVPTIAPTTVRKPAAKLTFSTTTALHQFWHQTRLEMRSIFKGVLFLVLLAFGTVNLIGLSSVLDQIVGTPAYPVTYLMLTVIQGAFAFLLFIIITFYCGELIWKERSLNLSEVYDAMPVPNWVYLSAKLVGQGAVIFAFLAYGTLVAIGIQIYRGYYHFELGVYAKGLLVIVVPFLLLACLASFFQVSAGKKSIGFLLMILFFISRRVMGSLDLDHYLYRYASNLPAPYSDMNGYGHFVQPLFWFYLYWCL